MEWVFDDKDKEERKKRLLELLAASDPAIHVEAKMAKTIHPKVRGHFNNLIKEKGGHRNAMIHSRKTLEYLLDLMKGGSGPPPPWVC